MRRNVLFIAVLMMVSLACESVQAKSRRHEMRYGHPGDRREMMVDARRPAHYPAYGRPHSRPHVSHHMPPRVDCHGYLPGWHGRVRCVNGLGVTSGGVTGTGMMSIMSPRSISVTLWLISMVISVRPVRWRLAWQVLQPWVLS